MEIDNIEQEIYRPTSIKEPWGGKSGSWNQIWYKKTMGFEREEGKSKMCTIPTPTPTPTPTPLSRLESFLFTIIEFVSPALKIE